mgnify:CR=1 FL=1
MMYLGKMNFKQFAQMAQAFGAPIIEREEHVAARTSRDAHEHIGDNVARFNYCYLADTGNQVYYKCDNIYVWLHSPMPDNVKSALEEAKKLIGARRSDDRIPTL